MSNWYNRPFLSNWYQQPNKKPAKWVLLRMPTLPPCSVFPGMIRKKVSSPWHTMDNMLFHFLWDPPSPRERFWSIPLEIFVQRLSSTSTTATLQSALLTSLCRGRAFPLRHHRLLHLCLQIRRYSIPAMMAVRLIAVWHRKPITTFCFVLFGFHMK